MMTHPASVSRIGIKRQYEANTTKASTAMATEVCANRVVMDVRPSRQTPTTAIEAAMLNIAVTGGMNKREAAKTRTP